MIANRESRTRPDSSDWALDQEVFARIKAPWECQVDLFSAAWNSKLPKFYAWTPQPGAAKIDAFSVVWKNLKAFASPLSDFFRRAWPKLARQGASNYSSGEPILAQRSMVSAVAVTGSGRHESSEAVQGPADIARRPGAPSSADRVAVMWRRFQSQGLSEEVVQLLLEGTRNTTRSTYRSAWCNWVGWCHERDPDPVSASVNSVLEYLTGLQAANFSYSLVNIHRSMLSSTLERSGTIPIGQLPYVKQLLKGVFNSNPPRPKYSRTWDVKVVASLLASWGQNDQLNLTQLSKKLATLLALATFLIVSELSSILSQSVSFSDSGVSFSLGRPSKAQRSGALRTISVGKLSDPLLCPVRCLGYYIFTTDVNRIENNNVFLLVGAIVHFKHVSSSSISRWIKSVLI